MRLYPESASVQLEFDKVRSLLVELTKTALGRQQAEELRIHTRRSYIETELRQSHQYLQLLAKGQSFQHDHVYAIAKELKLLGISGAVLSGETFLEIKSLAETIEYLFRWFDEERKAEFNALFEVLSITRFEKSIPDQISRIIGEDGRVVDNASDDLARIRLQLYKKRGEQRRTFDKLLNKLQRSGYIADIEES
ncbi:MAG: DNA mismatch repair protein MutS, partial [Chitinophagaceae bacterium]